MANITGSATAIIAVTSFTPTVNGCRLIVSNNTTGGFGATFAGMTIPNGQAVEFIYTNGVWKTTAGGTGAANNIYNANGTLSGNRTVTQGANTLTFNSTAVNGFSVDGTTFSVDGANNRVGLGLSNPNGKLHLYEPTGTSLTSTSGSLILEHGNNGGESSILFKSAVNAASDYGYIKFSDDGSGNGSSVENSLLEIGVQNDVPGNVFQDDIAIMSSGNVGIGTRTPLAQFHTVGSVMFSGAGTPVLGRSLVSDSTGLATWQNPLASNTNNTAITASATQVAVPSTNVQGAISNLATAIKSVENSTIYNSNGTLSGNRTVTQGANTLTFNSTAVNGFSVDGTTFSVDAVNNRVGIGTSTPSKKLTVENGSIRPAMGNNENAGIFFPTDIGGGSGDEAFIRYFTQGGENTKLQIGINNDSDDDISFYQGGAERMNIYNGNVGIGDTTPNAPLQFSNTVVNRKIVMYEGANNDNEFYGFGVNSGTLRYQVSGLTARHVFYASSSDTNSNELMRIQGNGRVGIGNANPLAQLDLRGIKSSGAGTGTGGNSDNPSQAIIPAGNDGNNRRNDWPAGWGGGLSTWDIVGASTFMNGYLTRSDFRLKNDIKSVDNSIFSNFMKIRPVTYFMKEQTKETEGLQYGFIAQEIRDLFPSMVTKSDDPNGIIGMNYQALISPTIYMVQQQQAKIDELQKQVDSQNEKLSKMEEELKQIKQLLSK